MDLPKIPQTIQYLSGKFPDCSETFQTVWKVSRQSGNFLHCPETFHTVKKISILYGNFADRLKTYQTVWKLSEQSGNFLDKYFIVCSIVATSISCTFEKRVLAFWHVCRESDLRTFGKYMSRKRFTLFWRIYVAKTIYALRPESFCA